MGVDKASSLAPYGDYWRLHRRLWTNYLGASSINHYSELMALEAKALPPRLINATKDTFTETRLSVSFPFANVAIFIVPTTRTVVKLLLGIAYGMKVDSLEDEASTCFILVSGVSFRDMTVRSKNGSEHS